jgi:PAS domain S-box-containing protein
MAKAQIFIVEDDNIVVLELRDRLQRLGYAVAGVASYGKEAIAKAAEMRPHLVLMDVRLKGAVDGVEAAQEIRTRFNIPVVYLTAYADEDTLQRAKITEPYGYIIKPFQERELHTAIEIALYKHKAEEALRKSEKRFRELVENANDIIYTHDLEGNFTSANPAATRIYGYTVEEILRLNIAQLVDPEYLPLVRQKIRKKLEGSPRTGPYELLTYSKESDPIWVEVSTRLLEGGGQPIGVLGIARDITERKQAEEELRQSYVKLQKALEGTVHTLVSAIEMRDPYTGRHQRRVAQLACAIAKEMSLPEERIEGLLMAGLIHDLGKINVPAEILNKPGALTDIQYSLIQAHSQIGYDILKTMEFPWPVAQIVLQNHERMDGSGYPQGLSGEEIILEARILAVADVVEAMASRRPYRSALGIDRALKEISQNRGILYDPEVVDTCLKLFTEKGFNFEQEMEMAEFISMR